jgi:hypothetical protein
MSAMVKRKQRRGREKKERWRLHVEEAADADVVYLPFK